MEVTDIIIGLFTALLPIVAPLYYLVLDLRQELGVAESERDKVSGQQDDMADRLTDLRNEIVEARMEMQGVMMRSELNQRHIHELLVSETDGPEEIELGDAPHGSDECPFGDKCPWHG